MNVKSLPRSPSRYPTLSRKPKGLRTLSNESFSKKEPSLRTFPINW